MLSSLAMSRCQKAFFTQEGRVPRKLRDLLRDGRATLKLRRCRCSESAGPPRTAESRCERSFRDLVFHTDLLRFES